MKGGFVSLLVILIATVWNEPIRFSLYILFTLLPKVTPVPPNTDVAPPNTKIPEPATPPILICGGCTILVSPPESKLNKRLKRNG